MQVKCEYCGSFIEATDEKCPNCGATNLNMARNVDETPRTIEELKQWYTSRNLPPEETTRFFIGKNHQGPRAFGIYKDGINYIVYKNKDTGERAIRYEGTDEAYAVNEIYLKLKTEILNQKARNASNGDYGGSGSSGKKGFGFPRIGFAGWAIGIFLAIATAFGIYSDAHPGEYYQFEKNGAVYYNIEDDWYYYDEYSKDYLETTIPEQYYANLNEYKYDGGEFWDTSIMKFEDSAKGEEMDEYYHHSSDFWDTIDDSDSDYDWDSSSDSWDSGGSDWSSDW